MFLGNRSFLQSNPGPPIPNLSREDWQRIYDNSFVSIMCQGHDPSFAGVQSGSRFYRYHR